MAKAWNLTPGQWSNVLLDGATPKTVAGSMMNGKRVPWDDLLTELTAGSERVLDLGSGKGDLSALLGLRGRNPTLVDWSKENLAFSAGLFAELGIRGHFCLADVTKPLPFRNRSFDVVFSCGVFEYFTSEETTRILREAFRVSRKRVIAMVPNACSIPYRIGKWYMERRGAWHWGGEVPSYSLKREFRNAGSARTIEFSIAAKHSLNFLTMPMGGIIQSLCARFLRMTDDSNASLFRQGYLLVTIGDTAPHLSVPDSTHSVSLPGR